MVADSDWIELAVITQPHGVRGQVKIKSFSEPEDGFARYPQLTDASGMPVKLRLAGEAQGLLIASIDGVSDRNAAERWRGRKLGIPRSALPPLEADGRFYIADLIGMQAVDGAGTAYGHVSAVQNFGAGDLLELTRPDGSSDFYSFTDSNFPAIDHAARRITFAAPELLGSREEEAADDNPAESL